MREKIKNYGLGLCLFVFLFMVIGSGFHLTPGAAFIAAASGTPLVIYAFNRRSTRPICAVADAQRAEPASEVHLQYESGHEIPAPLAATARPWHLFAEPLRVLHSREPLARVFRWQ